MSIRLSSIFPENINGVSSHISMGDKLQCDGMTGTYVVASVASDTMALINIEQGSRWTDPAFIPNESDHFSEEEVRRLIGECKPLEKWTKVADAG